MTLAGWPRGILIGFMLAWTVVTAVSGWFALRDTLGHADAEDTYVATIDIAAPGETAEVRSLQGAEARAAATERPAAIARAQPAVTPTRAASGAQAVPKYAGAAGVDRRARAADGEEPRRVPVAGRDAKAVVVLDPGHGRGDPGAVHHIPGGTWQWDITEAESNQRGAELIRDELQEMGYEVYLTREGAGQGPGAPLPLQFITSDLYARVALAKAVDADVYLAIHGNGASVKSISGPETWYCGKHEEGAANEDLARRVQQAMMDALREMDYAPPDRGVKEDAESHHSGDFCQFVVTRETPVPAALLEFLFLSNDADAAALLDPRAHPLMARHVAAAIDAFLRDRGRQ